MLGAITREFQVSNYIEAAVWCAIGGIIAVASWRWSRAARRDALIAAIDLVVFGASDLVEAQTGGWWRPWWLLAWKGACLIVVVVLAARYFARRG